jgi:hypothetical protein
MHFERQLRHALQRGDDGRPDRDVRHEMAVHDVDVQQIRAAGFHARHFVRQAREVGGEDGGGDLHRQSGRSRLLAQRLTSIEIGSPNAT